MRKKIDKKEIAKEICKAAKLYKTSFLQEVRICVTSRLYKFLLQSLSCRKFAFVFNEENKVIRQLSINTLRKDFHL